MTRDEHRRRGRTSAGSRGPEARLAAALLFGLAVGCGDERNGAGSAEGPWTVQRAVDSDSTAPTDRVSRANVSRDRYLPSFAASVVLSGLPGSRVEFEVTRAQVPDTAAAPVSVELRFQGRAGERRFPVSVVGTGSGKNPWYTCRADVSGGARDDGTLTVVVDGEDLSEESAWLCSVPRVFASRDDEHRYDVLIVSVDTLRADHLGCYGFDRDTSPNLDALAKRSVFFEHCVSQASWTLPSYSSILTGLYPEAHQVFHRNRVLASGFSTFVEAFANAGYATGAVVSGTFTDAFWGFDQGFDQYDDFGTLTPDDKVLEIDPTNPEAFKAAEAAITSPEVTDKAIAWLDQHAGSRFLYVAQYFDPHSDRLEHPGVTVRFPERPAPPPRNPRSRKPPPEDLARQASLYEGEVSFTDQHIGRLLDHVVRSGLAEHTIVLFCADHGEEFNERYQMGHGHQIFNELVHVPLMMEVPGVDPCKVSSPVANVDIGPTLAELCGVAFDLPKPGGESLVPLIRGRASMRSAPVLSSRISPVAGLDAEGNEVSPRDFVRIDEGDLSMLFVTPLPNRNGRTFPPQPYLFHWSDDPFQVNNLATTDAETARRMLDERRTLDAQLEAQRAQYSAATKEMSEEMKARLEKLGYEDKDENAKEDVVEGASGGN